MNKFLTGQEIKGKKITKILIKQCLDSLRWYSNLIGETVPFVKDRGDEWQSREPGGFINFVQYEDGVLIDEQEKV